MIFCLTQIWETMFFPIMNITLHWVRTMGMRDIAKNTDITIDKQTQVSDGKSWHIFGGFRQMVDRKIIYDK